MPRYRSVDRRRGTRLDVSIGRGHGFSWQSLIECLMATVAFECEGNPRERRRRPRWISSALKHRLQCHRIDRPHGARKPRRALRNRSSSPLCSR